MKKSLAILAAAFLVCGAGVANLQSVKSGDYHALPKRIVVSDAPFGFSSDFGNSLTRKMADCGVALAFFPLADADAQLKIRVIGSETKKNFRPYYHEYTAMTRYEFTLVDAASKANVWKAQGDFEQDEPKEKMADEQEAVLHRSNIWADHVVEQLRNDRLIGRCGSSVAIDPPVPSQAPPGQPKPQGFTINGITYDTPEAAEAGMRGTNAELVAKLTPQAGPVRGGLLVVLPVEKAPQITTVTFPNQSAPKQDPGQMAQIVAYMMVMSRVWTEAYLDALKKDNLFADVQTIRADDLAAEDFRDQPYKLYLVPGTPGHWFLAKQGGATKPLAQGPAGTVTQEALQKWLTGVKNALDALDG